MGMEQNEIITDKFRNTVWNYYKKHGRHDMPWRHTKDPYSIMVSEVMLQQTQVKRVEKFYPKFLKAFPDFKSLARASLKKVLLAWQGMGYNRRVRALQKLAQEVLKKYDGRLPNNTEALVSLPGIGKATAGAIMAYAFNKPVPFIETNVRRVFIYHFFTYGHPDRAKRVEGSLDKLGMTVRKKVDDKEILGLVEKTLDYKNPSEWYWALMDYGTYLATQYENPNRRSKLYKKQAKFEGSMRQVRGEIIKLLLTHPALATLEITNKIKRDRGIVEKILVQLMSENFIFYKKGKYRLTN